MKHTLFIVFFTLVSFFGQATHIVGGGIQVQWQGGNDYKISLKILRDCLNGNPGTTFSSEPTLVVALYTKNTNQLTRSITLNLESQKKVDFFTAKCGVLLNQCVEEGIFTGVVDLNGVENTAGYYLIWERCCRNSIISNINSPGAASMAFYAEIPQNSLKNSTPYYSKNPVTLICVGDTFRYNLGFLDNDSDSLSYSFVNPLNGFLDDTNPTNNGNVSNPGPYPDVTWSAGFSANNAINGNPPLTINKLNGDLIVRATQVGVYVAAIKVDEFRNNVKIGEVRLELQFNAVICPPIPEPSIDFKDSINTGSSQTIFEVEVPNKVCFDINVKDQDDIKDSFTLIVNSAHFSSSYISQPEVQKLTKGVNEIKNKFCWQTTCELNNAGTVGFTISVIDTGCPNLRTTQKDIFVKIKPMRVLNPPVFDCLGLLNNQTQLNWIDTNTSNILKGFRIYRGINDSNYTLLAEIGKSITQYIDVNTPNNSFINYTYKISCINLCDSEGVLTPVVGTLNSIPKLSVMNDLNQTIADTIILEAYDKFCFKIKTKEIGDSLSLNLNSVIFNDSFGEINNTQKLSFGKDSVETSICWSPNCEAIKLNYVQLDIETIDNKCPIKNKIDKRIWLKVQPARMVSAANLLCMKFDNDSQTYVYFGDTSNIESFKYFLIYRGIDFSNYTIIDTISTKNVRYIFDKNSPNNKQVNYCYFMIGVNKCDLLGYSSDTLSTLEQINFIPKKQILNTVTVEDNKLIRVNWNSYKEGDFTKYYLYKSTNLGDTFRLINVFRQREDTFFVDENVEVNIKSYCYYLVTEDTCENKSPIGKIACSILLKGESRAVTHNLSWTQYDGWENGVKNYQMMRRYVNNNIFQSIINTKNIFLADDAFDKDEGAYYYHVIASSNDSVNTIQSKSNELFLFQNPNLFVPNAFTNNSDGLNDELEITYSFVKTMNLKIFARTGHLVFETNNIKEKWPASYHNAPVQNDVYFYVLDYKGYDDIERTKKGTITLLR